jgi:UDP-glucose 6-dehydrogenase
LINELKEKEIEVEKFEQNIKKRHNRIDKKQLKVDKLNRQWAVLKDSGIDENSGPMEAKKNSILKSTKELEDQIINIQKQWISNQTDLIER